jgi:Family of unknown function (DUF5765)
VLIAALLNRPAHAHNTCPRLALIPQLLQLGQYLVIDRCDSKINQLLTWLAYVHVALQPVVFNEFVFGQPQPTFNKPIISHEADRVLHWAVRRLATAASVLLLIKGAPALGQLLGLAECPWLTAVLGPTAAAALAAPPACGSEMLCGAALCSVTGTHHVGWVVPSLPHSYYLPTAHIHGFFFFLPAFVLGGPPQWVLAGAAMLTGPLLTEIILGDDATARRHEWAAIWCMFSLGQVRTAAHCCTAASCCTAPFSSQGGCLAVFLLPASSWRPACPAVQQLLHCSPVLLHLQQFLALAPRPCCVQVLLLFVVELLGSRFITGRAVIPGSEADDAPGAAFSDLLAPARKAAALATGRTQRASAAVVAHAPAARPSARGAAAGRSHAQTLEEQGAVPTQRRSTRLQSRGVMA